LKTILPLRFSRSRATADTTEPEPRPGSRARHAARLVFELVVIFIGVYSAFALSEYQKQREADERRHQIRAALIAEIEDITRNTRRVATVSPPQLAGLDSAIAAGMRPPLQPILEPIRVETHMWDATLQSGGLDLFDVPTIYALSSFYNRLNEGFEQIVQLNRLSETILLPNLGAGPDEFYDRETGALLPKYSWYTGGYRRLIRIAQELTEQGDSLVVQLHRANGRPTAAAPAPRAAP
jgi:hypothetical protein